MHKQAPNKPAELKHVRLNVSLPPDVHEWLKNYHAGPSAGITKLARWQMERIEQVRGQLLVNPVEHVQPVIYRPNEEQSPITVRSGAFCDGCGSPLSHCECREKVAPAKLTATDFTQLYSVAPHVDTDGTPTRESRWLVPCDHPALRDLPLASVLLLIDEAFQSVKDTTLHPNSSWLDPTIAFRRRIVRRAGESMVVTVLYRKHSDGMPS